MSDWILPLICARSRLQQAYRLETNETISNMNRTMAIHIRYFQTSSIPIVRNTNGQNLLLVFCSHLEGICKKTPNKLIPEIVQKKKCKKLNEFELIFSPFHTVYIHIFPVASKL